MFRRGEAFPAGWTLADPREELSFWESGPRLAGKGFAAFLEEALAAEGKTHRLESGGLSP